MATKSKPINIIYLKTLLVSVFAIWTFCNELAYSSQEHLDCDIPFSSFLDKMKAKALNQGISAKIVANVLSNTKNLEEVIKLDRSQKTFRLSFKDFSDKSVNEYRLLNGRKYMKKYQALFESIWNESGIPPEVIIAFWGMETDYGMVQGNFHTLSALGTLANDCRRSEFFQLQYLAAMKLVENNMLDPMSSIGAWAGEFGQIQMLPSEILAFGSDGDGDGKVQLDKSPEDAILTAAKLIMSKGWTPRKVWFEEVIVSEEFQWREAGLGRSRPIKKWVQLGIEPRQASFHAEDIHTQATLVLPQGWKGPKFLAYPNFDIFMKWNDSFLYSTTAAYFANRINGADPYLSEGPSDILNTYQMVELQEILNALGYDVGKIDGILGAKTRQSVRIIQINLGFPADSWPTIELLNYLKVYLS